MRLVIQVTDEVAAELRAGAPHAAASALDAMARRMGVVLRPQHHADAGRELASYFQADVPDAMAEQARTALSAQPGVLAAFVKPPDALP
jgi:hypothetical protein